MSAPDNELAFDLDIARQAAKRWRESEDDRERKQEALAKGKFMAVEPKERLVKRVNRLLDKVKERSPIKATLPETLEQLATRDHVTEDDISSVLVERVIGETRDFLAIEFLENALFFNRSVGRIVTSLDRGRVGYGTGFMVSPSLLMTNNHVLASRGVASRSTVEFDYQRDRLGRALTVQRFALQPERFFLTDRDFDFALVAVAPRSTSSTSLSVFGYCPFIAEEGKIAIGEPINIIQHPAGEMKQIVMRENKLLDLPKVPDRFAHYEADTEPGSSGSPVFNDQWEVVALHHSGVPKMDDRGNILDRNGKIWRSGDDPTRIAWIGNEGIRVSRIVKFIKEDAKIAAHEEALRAEFLKAGTKGIEGARTEKDAESERPHPFPRVETPALSRDKGALTFTVPLSITVSLGAVGKEVERNDFSGATTELERIEPDADYPTRPGYDPMFLGFKTLFPRLSSTVKPHAARINGTKNIELKYHHYSVVMNAKRKLAFVSGVNFDANAPAVHRRESGDRWFFDPRIPQDAQAGNALYADNPIDRGHLTRRADAAWGSDDEEAKLANDDTFHWTNCSPQHEIYNQSTKASKKGLLLWGNIEDHIAREGATEKQRLTVFNGPIFRDDDRIYRGIQLPREYWKLVVFESDEGRPKAVAFLLSQESLIKALPAEEFEPGEYKPFQIKIRDLEQRTHLDFRSLHKVDPLESEIGEERLEADTESIALERLADMVL
jgi:endonuclease G